jgi:hypothetical protein
MIRVHQAEVVILIRGSKGAEIRKTAIWFKILLGSVIPTKSHHKEDSMVVTRL